MQKTHALLAILLLTISYLGYAQAPALQGTVKGSNGPVEAATVSLLRAKDSSLVKMAVSSKEGSFSFDALPAGAYLLTITAVGYQKYWSPGLSLQPGQPLLLPAIALQTAEKRLADVIITARKPLVEQKLDRTVVNIEGQASNVGLNALEVLEKSPGITVDKDGNISLKGKQGVMVLIDGKPSYLGGSDLVSYLQALPAGQLELLEIMTNPPAKYDAAGNAGIINIKTKKTRAKGFNGNMSSAIGMGNLPFTNHSINVNYRNNQWNFFGSYSLNFRRGFQDLFILRNFRNQQTHELLSIFDQQSHLRRWGLGNNAKAGVDFYASKKTTLGLVVSGFLSDEGHNNLNTTLIKAPDGLLQNRTEASNRSRVDLNNIGVNLNLRHLMDSAGQELTADLDYIGYSNGNEQFLNNYFFDKEGRPQQADELIYGNLPSQISIVSAKADYTKPLKKGGRFDAGLKSSLVRTDNNMEYFMRNTTAQPWELDEGRSNHFIYTENINAAYVNLQKEWSKKWSTQAGLRLEHTYAKGDQKTSAQNFERNYAQLFPTAYIQYKASDKHSWVLNYGRRIERPNYRDMNPFMYFLDKYTFEQGNPNLQPQFAHNVELTYSFKGILNTTLNYNSTNNILTEIFEQDDATNTTFIRKGNIAKRSQLGLSMNAGLPVTPWWPTNVFANVFYNQFEGLVNNAPIQTSLLGFTTNVQNTFTFKHGWGAELSGFYRAKQLEGVIVTLPMGVINVGISKKVLKDKGVLRLNFRDPLDLQYFRGSAQYQNIDIRFTNYWDNRTVNLGFSYRFGKPIKGQQQRRQTGSAADEQNRVGGSN